MSRPAPPRYARLYAYSYLSRPRDLLLGSSSVVGSREDYMQAAQELIAGCPGTDRVEVWPSGAWKPITVYAHAGA